MDPERFRLLSDKYRWAIGTRVSSSAQHEQRQAQLQRLPGGEGHTSLAALENPDVNY